MNIQIGIVMLSIELPHKYKFFKKSISFITSSKTSQNT